MTNIVKTSVLPNAPKKIVSRIVDKSRFMKRAHAVARTYEGDYIACLALAMRKLYLTVGGPQLVANYKPTFDEYGLAKEIVSYQQEDSTWLYEVISSDIIEFTPRVNTSTRYSRAKALANGISHIKHEYEKIFKEMTHMISVVNNGGVKANIAKLRANNLAIEAEKLAADIRLAETFKPKQVHCDVPQRKLTDMKARRFTDTLLGTYDEINSKYQEQ